MMSNNAHCSTGDPTGSVEPPIVLPASQAIPKKKSSSDGSDAGTPNPDRAFERWREALGSNNVSTGDELLKRLSQTTLPRANRPAAVIRPATTEEVIASVRIAGETGMSVYPISRGKNWGYGDACPAGPDQVIMDLGRMNRIAEVNEKLAYAVIEPGVTQGQLAEYLEQHHPSLMLDVTGAGPEASIVGNSLERGFGHTPYGDHFAHSCAYRVVLPDGSIVETGFGAYGQRTSDAADPTELPGTAHVFPTGLGPALDGLFTQSNLGIVTRMTVWLMPRPQRIEAFAMRLSSNDSLGALVESLRELRKQGIVQSAVHVANDLRVISSRLSCPTKAVASGQALTDEQRADLRNECSVGRWNMIGATYGDAAYVKYARRKIRRGLRALGRTLFLTRGRVEWLVRIDRWLKSIGLGRTPLRHIASARSALDLLEGIPTREHLRGAFWRCGGDQNRDPIEAGLIWISPVIPLTGSDAERLVGIVEPHLQDFGFDPLITLTAINSRAMCGVISINYDRNNEDEAALADEAYTSLLASLVDAGYPPYRICTSSMATMFERNQNRDLLTRLKQSLDPSGTISPGRYIAKAE